MSSQDKIPNGCTVYNQYTGTNLERFLKKLCQSFHDSTAPFNHYFNQINNLSIAEGAVLDMFGEFLNFNRYITFNDPLDIVRPNTEGIEEYLVITQRDNDILKQCRLGDKAYRTVLRLLMESKNTMSSVVTLSKIISDIVDADVFVGDHMNMQYITYYFLDRIPGWLEVTMHNYDILPRPAGMSAEYISAFSRFFGFLIDDPTPDPEATAKVFSGFWKARFPTITPKQLTLPYSKLLQTNYRPASLNQEQYTQLLHNYTVARTADEVRIRDTNALSREVERQSTSHDHKYMYIPKSHAGIIFPSYVEFLEATDEPTRTSLSWQAKHKALTAFIQNTESIHSRYLTREVYTTKRDPRHDLYYDHKTHFYFYSPPDSSGHFNPYTLANIYQDNCGIWYPQDDIGTQLKKGYIDLRRDDYGSSRVTKTIDTSPLLDALRPFWLQNKDALESSGDYFKFVALLTNFHTASRLFYKIYPVHLSSFRAALDMEYDAASLMKLAESINNKILSRPGSRSQQEVDYYRDIYRRIIDYYGDRSGTYYYFYRDYDKNCPAYKRRVFIKTQRYLVMKAINTLDSLYTQTRDFYNQLSKYTTPSLETKVYTTITDLKTLLQTDPWLPIEVAHDGYGYTEAYSAKNLRNDEVDYYIRDFERRRRGNVEWLDFSKQCRDACDRLRNDCGKGGDPISKSRWRDRHDSWLCYVNPDYDYIPKFEQSDRNNWDSWGSYYTTKEQGGIPRGCNLSGYRSFSDGYYGHSRRVSRLEDELRGRDAQLKGLRAERDNRTEVTKDRTLTQVMDYYNGYTPPDGVPPPPDPLYDISIDYPDYLETDYGAHLLQTELDEIERQKELAREARGLENIQYQTQLKSSLDQLMSPPTADDFDAYIPPPYTEVELAELELGRVLSQEPKLQTYLDKAERLKEEAKKAKAEYGDLGDFSILQAQFYDPESSYRLEHNMWRSKEIKAREDLEKAKAKARNNPPKS